MTRKAALCLLGLAACDSVFGLERTIDAPPGDRPPGAAVVSGRLALRTSNVDPSGAQGDQEQIYDPTLNAPVLSVVLDDGTTPDVTYRDDGTFELPLARAGQSYRLHVVTPSSDVEYQMSAPALDLLDRTAGRLDRKTPAADSRLVVTNAFGAAAFGYLTTFGAPTVTRLSAPATLVFGPNATVSPIGRLGLPDATKNDRIFLTTFAGVPSTTPTYYTLAAVAQSQQTIPDGGAVTFAGTITATAASGCARIHTDRGTEYTRLMSLVTGTIATMGTDWFIEAVPMREDLFGVGATPLATSAGVPNQIDELSIPFANPFPGTGVVLSSGVGFGRDLLLAGTTTPARILIGDREIVPADVTLTGCTGQTAIASLGLPFPMLLKLGDDPLATEGATAVLGQDDPVVTWKYDGGDAQLASVQLVELVPQGAKTTLQVRTAIRTIGTSAVIPRALFVTGRTYVLRLDASMGYPHAVDGDFRTLAWPQGNATSWTHTFVAP